MERRRINWAGNYTFKATAVHHPQTIDEIRRLVANAPKIHAIGSYHSFNDIADSAELIVLDSVNSPIEIDRAANSVTVGAGVRYSALAPALEREGLALHNMASLPHITVAGAVATATHGSGDKSGNLATAVSAIEIVTSDGDIHRVSRGEPDFAGMVVNLGALGVVTRLTLDVQPSYRMRQYIYEHLDWDVLLARFDVVTSSADSVSLFTDFGDTINQVWAKTRVRPDEPHFPSEHFLGAPVATRRLNPVVANFAEFITEQLGIEGSWADRLPHVVEAGVTERGDHFQSEYMVARHHAVDALTALREISAQIHPCIFIAEFRTVAADELWLSTAYKTDTVGIHFSFKPDPDAVRSVLPAIEAALEPFQPRPHWGKIFNATASDLKPRYERFDDFQQLANRLDPRGAFRNAFLERCLFG